PQAGLAAIGNDQLALAQLIPAEVKLTIGGRPRGIEWHNDALFFQAPAFRHALDLGAGHGDGEAIDLAAALDRIEGMGARRGDGAGQGQHDEKNGHGGDPGLKRVHGAARGRAGGEFIARRRNARCARGGAATRRRDRAEGAC
ncbi:MAG: hypothetical protein ACK5QX_00240, partial [bacterium]